MIREFSVSTVYCARDASSGSEVLKILKSMGFDTIELNPHLNLSMVEDIAAEKEEGKINISSVHSICPKVKNPPQERSIFSSYRISSLNEEERKKAVEKILQTASLARRVEGESVIVHAGEVETPTGLSRLYGTFLEKGPDSREYNCLRDTLIEERAEKSPPYFKNALRSLEEIIARKPPQVSIALETRSFYTEIPTLAELSELTDIFGDDIYYWHDTGHAALQEKLRFVESARDYLCAAGDRLKGMHFHDIRGLRDHIFPGEGEIDFGYMAPYLRENKDISLVLEIHPGNGERGKAGFEDFIRQQSVNKTE